MTNTYVSGSQSFIKAAFEDVDVWGQAASGMTEPNSTTFSFGQGVDSSITHSNNKQRVYGTGSRDPSSVINLQYSGTATVNGSVCNFYWLLGVLGANVDGGAGPSSYTHTYSPADSLPTMCIWRRAKFSTEKNQVIQGAVVNQCTLKAAINEPVKFTLECPFRYSKIDTDVESAVTDTQKVYTFAGGTISIGGASVAAIQNFELTIVNTSEMILGVGSRFPAGYVAKKREYNFKFTAAISDFTLLSQFYDGSTGIAPSATANGEISAAVLTFVNGDSHQCVLTFTGAHFNEETLPQSADDVMKDDITGFFKTMTSAVYTNATAAAPAQATNI